MKVYFNWVTDFIEIQTLYIFSTDGRNKYKICHIR